MSGVVVAVVVVLWGVQAVSPVWESKRNPHTSPTRHLVGRAEERVAGGVDAERGRDRLAGGQVGGHGLRRRGGCCFIVVVVGGGWAKMGCDKAARVWGGICGG